MIENQPMMGATPMSQGMPGQPGGGTNSQGPVPMGPPVDDPYAPMPQMEDDSMDEFETRLDSMLQEHNIAEKLKTKEAKGGGLLLDEIGQRVLQGINTDNDSRRDWMDANKEWIRMAMLVREERTWPWQNASNVKYPLIATAAMQFSARAYPSLVPADGRIVKATVTKQHAGQMIYDAAQRVAHHMSFQLRERVHDWEEDMDKLLMTMAITGICFKKTYYQPRSKELCSNLVYPENLIINYYAKSIEQAYRVTEVLTLRQNEIQERINQGIFLDQDYGSPQGDVRVEKNPEVPLTEPSTVDNATPIVFYACHTYWDLDEDGYEEPYIITIHEKTGKVARIQARWTSADVEMEDDEIVSIRPLCYFTAFPFIPNPDGSIYGMGFGLLLTPLNESVNSLINQLIDSGTLNNLQSGFIAKGLRLRVGEISLGPGEWKVVNATGDQMKNGIVPLPAKDPSPVLFQLLGMLIQSGNQLASIAEIFVGKMPGQNTPATTTQETVQQGMAVFTAIYKRVYRALKKEFKKLYHLNKLYPELGQEAQVLAGVELPESDYKLPDWVIVPGADPIGDSQTVRMQKHQFVLQNVMPLGTINPMVMTERILRDLELPDAQEVVMQPQPQQDPKAAALAQKGELDKQKAQLDAQAKQTEMQAKERMHQLEAAMMQMKIMFEKQMQSIKLQGEQQMAQMDMVINTMKQQYEAKNLQMQSQFNEQRMIRDDAFQRRQYQQKLKQGEETFKQRQRQQRQSKTKKEK